MRFFQIKKRNGHTILIFRENTQSLNISYLLVFLVSPFVNDSFCVFLDKASTEDKENGGFPLCTLNIIVYLAIFVQTCRVQGLNLFIYIVAVSPFKYVSNTLVCFSDFRPNLAALFANHRKL